MAMQNTNTEPGQAMDAPTASVGSADAQEQFLEFKLGHDKVLQMRILISGNDPESRLPEPRHWGETVLQYGVDGSTMLSIQFDVSEVFNSTPAVAPPSPRRPSGQQT